MDEHDQSIVVMDMEPLVLTADTLHIHSFRRSRENPQRVFASVTLGELFTIDGWSFEWNHYSDSRAEDSLSQNNSGADARFRLAPIHYRKDSNPPTLFMDLIDSAIFHAVMDETGPLCKFVKGECGYLLPIEFRPAEWHDQTLNFPVNRLVFHYFECRNPNIYTVHIQIGEEIIYWAVPVEISWLCKLGDKGRKIQSPNLRKLIEQCLNQSLIISHAKGIVAQYDPEIPYHGATDWGLRTYAASVPDVPIPDFDKVMPPPIYFT